MKIYLVGGAVRDELLGIASSEKDFVVVGATPAEMLAQGYRQVGKDFPVFLHPETHEEYALARRERKVKPGYTGFEFDASQAVTLEEDLLRRDLTINAIAKDGETSQLVDPFAGQQDLKNKILRHVSPAFSEDPVRILRLARFAARFAHLGFKVHAETMKLMQDMVASGEVNALVSERVWKELERALGEKNPEQFFVVLQQCGALPILFPELGEEDIARLGKVVLNKDLLIRFAVLMHGLTAEQITALCQRLKVPSAYSELALLVAHNAQQYQAARSLSAEQLLGVLKKTDAFRRQKRFCSYLRVCGMLFGLEHDNFLASVLKVAEDAGKDFPADMPGHERGAYIDEQRIAAIGDYISQGGASRGRVSC